MPRKTKKQKIISSYRKKLRQLDNLQKSSFLIHKTPIIPINASHTAVIQPERTKESQNSIDKKNIIPIPSSYTNTEYDVRLKTHTYKDLQKTLVLTTLVLAFEFLIFYATLKGYLNTF